MIVNPSVEGGRSSSHLQCMHFCSHVNIGHSVVQMSAVGDWDRVHFPLPSM